MDCITELTDLLRTQGHPAKVVDDLDQRLRGPIEWTPVPGPEPVPTARAWQGKTGNWLFALVDFPIGDQPGHRPTDRGQNLGISNHAEGLVMMSDSDLFHRIAARLAARIRLEQFKDSFVGSGNVRPVRVRHLKPSGQSFLLKDETSIRQGIAWLEQHIKSLNGKIWGLPRSGAHFRFDEARRLAYVQGHDESTELLLTVMGYQLLPWPEGTPNN